MATYEITNPRYVRLDKSMIDVTWFHPVFGPREGAFDYTVIDGSGEEEMQAIWDALMAGEYGPIAELPE